MSVYFLGDRMSWLTSKSEDGESYKIILIKEEHLDLLRPTLISFIAE
jgi:hypothetical protein